MQACAPASLACIAASVVYFTPVPSHLNVRLRDALMPIIHQLWYAARQYSIPDPQTKQKIWHRRGGRLILGIKHGQLCPIRREPQPGLLRPVCLRNISLVPRDERLLK